MVILNVGYIVVDLQFILRQCSAYPAVGLYGGILGGCYTSYMLEWFLSGSAWGVRYYRFRDM